MKLFLRQDTAELLHLCRCRIKAVCAVEQQRVERLEFLTEQFSTKPDPLARVLNLGNPVGKVPHHRIGGACLTAGCLERQSQIHKALLRCAVSGVRLSDLAGQIAQRSVKFAGCHPGLLRGKAPDLQFLCANVELARRAGDLRAEIGALADCGADGRAQRGNPGSTKEPLGKASPRALAGCLRLAFGPFDSFIKFPVELARKLLPGQLELNENIVARHFSSLVDRGILHRASGAV